MSKAKISAKNDLTQGPILGKLISFAIPVILGNLCMQLYNVVDSIIVGNYVGTDALAAVGSSFSIMMLFNALFMGTSMGAQIVSSAPAPGSSAGLLPNSCSNILPKRRNCRSSSATIASSAPF